MTFDAAELRKSFNERTRHHSEYAEQSNGKVFSPVSWS